MNTIRKTIAAASGVVLSLGFALPAAALNVDSTVNAATQGSASVGNTGAGADVDAQVSADLGAEAESSGGTSDDNAGASGSAESRAAMEANESVTIQPLVITRGDVDAGRVEASVSSPSAVTTRAELSGYAAAEMKADSNIASIEAASDNVAVTYKQSAKLFGFIPVTVNATAIVDAGGDVTVSYPWYAFLMVTNKTDLEARIESKVKADVNLDASANAEAGADASAAAQAATQLSADAQAKVIAAVKAAMQAQLEAELTASAAGNVSVQ